MGSFPVIARFCLRGVESWQSIFQSSLRANGVSVAKQAKPKFL
ncbi:hypothetical protein [Helicobacter macacae]|nr:hypothetical protein [Helicobacter macacae]